MARENVKAMAGDVEATLVRSQPSVEIKLDGKGAHQVTVKAYADSMDEAVEQALAAMRKVRDGLGGSKE